MSKQKITVLHVDDEKSIQQTLKLMLDRKLVPLHPEVEFTYRDFPDHEQLNKWLKDHPNEMGHCFIVSDNTTNADPDGKGGEGIKWLISRDEAQRKIPTVLFSAEMLGNQAALQGVPFKHKLLDSYPSVLCEIEKALSLPSRLQDQQAARASRTPGA